MTIFVFFLALLFFALLVAVIASKLIRGALFAAIACASALFIILEFVASYVGPPIFWVCTLACSWSFCTRRIGNIDVQVKRVAHRPDLNYAVRGK